MPTTKWAVRAHASDLTAERLRVLTDKNHFNVPQQRMARHLGVGERTVRRWFSGEAPVPPEVEMLLTIYELMPSVRTQMTPIRFNWRDYLARADVDDRPEHSVSLEGVHV